MCTAALRRLSHSAPRPSSRRPCPPSLPLPPARSPARQVIAGVDGLTVRDGSRLTPDSLIVSADNAVCASVVNVVEAAVPMPF